MNDHRRRIAIVDPCGLSPRIRMPGFRDRCLSNPWPSTPSLGRRSVNNVQIDGRRDSGPWRLRAIVGRTHIFVTTVTTPEKRKTASGTSLLERLRRRTPTQGIESRNSWIALKRAPFRISYRGGTPLFPLFGGSQLGQDQLEARVLFSGHPPGGRHRKTQLQFGDPRHDASVSTSISLPRHFCLRNARRQ